jgi:hypothetical protein
MGTQYISMAWYLVKHSDYFTFTFNGHGVTVMVFVLIKLLKKKLAGCWSFGSGP